MGASSGMYAIAAAEPLATPALVPRRQFQKVKGASYATNREAARGLFAERYRQPMPASSGREYYRDGPLPSGTEVLFRSL